MGASTRSRPRRRRFPNTSLLSAVRPPPLLVEPRAFPALKARASRPTVHITDALLLAVGLRLCSLRHASRSLGLGWSGSRPRPATHGTQWHVARLQARGAAWHAQARRRRHGRPCAATRASWCSAMASAPWHGMRRSCVPSCATPAAGERALFKKCFCQQQPHFSYKTISFDRIKTTSCIFMNMNIQ